MPESSLFRRHFLGAATGAAAWLALAPNVLLAAGEAAARDGVVSPAAPWRVLTAEQAAIMDAFAAQIIPADAHSPGAREAHVTRFVDHGPQRSPGTTRPGSKRRSRRFMWRRPGSHLAARHSPN